MKKYQRYIGAFERDDEFPFNCPNCKRSTLFLDESSWFEKETESSKKAHSHVEHYPDWDEYIYSGSYKCSNPQCNEVVLTAGVAFWEESIDYENDEDNNIVAVDARWVKYYKPRLFLPSLDFFEIPEKTPTELRKLIKESFGLVLQSAGAASNKLRVALELLLTKHQIQSKTDDGKFIRLHNRIESIPEENILFEFKDSLLAIKWIGNAGSHEEDRINLQIVFDEFEIIQDLLKNIYSDRNIRTIVKEVNENKGPLSFWEQFRKLNSNQN